MNKHKECYKGFIVLSKAWYGPVNLKLHDYKEEVSFGYYHPDGGTTGEMKMRWYQLRDDKEPSAKLEVFYDGFDALSNFQDVVVELKKYDKDGISVEEFSQVLKKCGFKDRTETKMPK